MKKRLVWLLVGVLTVICAVTIVVSASNGSVFKELFYNNIKITLNGNNITPTDANGAYVEPFIIDGTTYLPVRAISNALGLDVAWDGTTNTVQLFSNGNSQVNPDNLYADLKNWVVKNGTTYGDYVCFSKSADNYGGDRNDAFNLFYWGDTDTLEVSVNSVIDSEYAINYIVYIPKNHTGKYEICASYYYRQTGEPVMEAKGFIDGALFDENYPLDSTSYYGDKSMQNEFMELARLGTCNTVNCFKEFLVKEKTGYTLNDIGFKNF